MVAAQALQRLIHKTWGQQKGEDAPIELPKKKPKNPKVYVVMAEARAVVPGSGPLQFKRNTRVDNPIIIRALKGAGAQLEPLE